MGPPIKGCGSCGPSFCPMPISWAVISGSYTDAHRERDELGYRSTAQELSRLMACTAAVRAGCCTDQLSRAGPGCTMAAHQDHCGRCAQKLDYQMNGRSLRWARIVARSSLSLATYSI